MQKHHLSSNPWRLHGSFPIAGEDAKYLQRLLVKRGFLKGGRADGFWDEASTKALADSMGWENCDTRIRRETARSTGRF